jgi:hypothetical protein
MHICGWLGGVGLFVVLVGGCVEVLYSGGMFETEKNEKKEALNESVRR